jgi:flagellar basal-body rod modification protein FlgD
MSSITGFLSHAAASPPAANTPAATPASASDPLANEQTFLKLLVSQLKNQNPLSPTDGTQFVSQLTSYSQLEQLIGIRQNTAAPASAAAAGTTTPVGKGA